MIGILDVNSGNIRSVANSIYELGFDYLLVNEKSGFDDVTHLIIPGVGHFLNAINHLKQTQLWDALNHYQQSQRPILGICLGMQLLASKGYEGGETPGLNFIPGAVNRFPEHPEFRVPHMGWNTVSFKKNHPVFEGIKDQRDFYFVHSYYYSCDHEDNIFGTTDYNQIFPSIIAEKHIIGFQFHPEKSQKNGLALLENFCRWDGTC